MEKPNPLSNPVFRNLFTAQVIALVGTGLSTVGLSLLAYNLAGDNAGRVLGIALAYKMIAYVFFAPLAGAIVHRFDRKPFLISLDIIRALLVLLMPFVSQLWHIYALIFLLNLFSAGFKPVFQAVMKRIVQTDDSILVNKPVKQKKKVMADALIEPTVEKKVDSSPKPVTLITTAAMPKDGWVAVPDVRGRSLRNATSMLRHAGLKVKPKGSGTVVWQSPAPGLLVKETSSCTIGLN